MNCDRCKKSMSMTVSTMSYFNTDTLCMDCQEKESKHPLYDDAVRAEFDAVRMGNYNFPGIGLPNDLK